MFGISEASAYRYFKDGLEALEKILLLAHAGLEYNSIVLKRNGKDIYLRYDDKYIDTIKKYSSQGLI